MLSGFFIYTHKGDLLLWRIFRNDIDRDAAVNAFRANIIHSLHELRSPVHTIAHKSYFHVKQANLWIVLVTADNVNAAMAFSLLYSLCSCFESYFGKISEENVRCNFSLIYEILDEVVDNGYAQNLDVNAIRNFITLGEGKLAEKKQLTVAEAGKMTMQATGAISWRQPDIRHKKNEILIDVVESVNVLIASDGKVLTANVSGQINCKCMLSGMPECKLGMNDTLTSARNNTSTETSLAKKKNGKIVINDFTFHQCVKLGKFEADRSINFIPPDGQFELLKYRVTSLIYLPFKVTPIITELGSSSSKIDIKVKLKANYKEETLGENIEIKIPLPSNVVDTKIMVLTGKAKYKPAEGGIIWRIKRMRGSTDTQLNAQVELKSYSKTHKKWARPPLSLKFQVPRLSSGLQIKHVRVFEKKLNYTSNAKVRYRCKAGLFEIRS